MFPKSDVVGAAAGGAVVDLGAPRLANSPVVAGAAGCDEEVLVPVFPKRLKPVGLLRLVPPELKSDMVKGGVREGKAD